MKLLQSEVGSSRKVNEWGFGTEFRFIFVACVWGEKSKGLKNVSYREGCVCVSCCVYVYLFRLLALIFMHCMFHCAVE